MKIFSLFVVIASCLLVRAYQIPVQLIEGLSHGAAEGDINASNLVTLLNQINSQYGTLLSAERNNVTIWSGNQHVSYRNGRLFLSNSSVVTTWQIQYSNQNQNLASICVLIPSFTSPRCLNGGSGYASIGATTSASYSPSLIGGKFVVFQGNYCLFKSDTDVADLSWTYNTECLRFDLRPSHETVTNPRGVDSDMVFFGAWESITGAITKTIGSVICAVAPNSDVADRIRGAGDAWGYCGPSHPC